VYTSMFFFGLGFFVGGGANNELNEWTDGQVYHCGVCVVHDIMLGVN
jgi:hypothetical protein